MINDYSNGTHTGVEVTAARLMIAVMCLTYPDVLNWFMTLPPEAMTSQATALTATVTGAMTGAFAVWLGHEK